MPLWGNKNQPVTANLTTTFESTEGAPLGTYVHVKGDQIDRKGSANAHAGNTVPGSRARTDFDMFESSIFNEFMPNMAVGVYGVYANSPDLGKNKEYHDYVNDIHARKKHLKKYKELPDGEQLKYKVVNEGCGYSGGPQRRGVPIRLYFANGYVDTTSVQGDIYFSGVIDPPDPKNGKITGYTVNQELFVDEPPNCDIDPPENFYIACNKNQLLPAGFAIDYAQSVFGKGDKVFYYVPSGNTPVAPLTGNTYYYIADVNVEYVAFSETPNGTPIVITDPRLNSDDPAAEQHTLQGEQAQIEAYIERANNIGSSHAGWILRKEFKGGRQGRVQTECLVAMSSLEEGVIPPGEPEPIVYDINPDYGTEFGGDTITITGENFISFEPENPMEHVGDTYATRVLFGNVFANDATVHVANNTSLTVVTPKANKPETVDVRVQTGYGISRVGPKTKFTYYITEPYIKSVTPNRGGYLGQTNVDIIGFNFGSTTQVQFDNINALSFNVVSNEYIRAVSPPHPNGTVNIIVTGANGASDPDPTSEFTYYSAIPTVSNVDPTFGTLDPASATINGTGFIQYNTKYVGDTSGLKVYFGDYEANITSVVSDTQLIVDPPAVLRPNTVNVIVRNVYGNSVPNANSKFRYYADGPTVSNCSPKEVSALVPVDVTVYGNNLWDATEVRYGGVFFVKNNIRVAADGKSLVFTTIPDANVNRYMTIAVDTPSGMTPDVYNCGINYINFPFIDDLSIHAIDYRFTNTVTVTGMNFNNPSFKVDNVYLQRQGTGPFATKYYANSSTIKIANNTSLTFQFPNFAQLGAPIFTTYVTVLSANNNLLSTNTAGSEVYVDNWTPFIERVDPKIGPVKGFTEIYCYGKNFAQSTIANAQLGEGPSGLRAKSVRVINNNVAVVVAPTVDANTVGKNYNVILNSTTCGSSPVGANTIFTYTNNSGTIQSFTLNYPGCGYNNNHLPIKITARLVSNGMIDNRAGTAGAETSGANRGRITSVVANTNFPVLFRGFDNTPLITIEEPEKYSFAANQSGFSGWPSSTRAFALFGAQDIFQPGDKVLYTAVGPGGPLRPLKNQTYYYVTQIQSGWPQSTFQLAETKADALANVALFINDTRLNSNQATNDISFVQGETANLTYTLVP